MQKVAQNAVARAAWALVLLGPLALIACGKIADGRDQATGKGLEGKVPVTEQPAPPAGTGDAGGAAGGAAGGGTAGGTAAGGGTTGDTAGGTAAGDGTGGDTAGGATDVGGTTGGTDDKPLTAASKTLEQCTAEKKAWTPVEKNADGSVKPAYCGEPLVDYCCSEPEIFRRFPQQETRLKELFEKEKAKGLKLYHCSSTATPQKTTFHFGQIGGQPALIHAVVFTSSTPFAVDPPTVGACPAQLTTNDLKAGG